MSGCCPVNSSPFLAPTYTNIGKISKLPSSDVEAYISSSEYVAGSPAVILFPDAFGWNTGRIRAVSDLFASEGYYSLVPKIMQPCVEGAQDGDGYPADGDMPGMGQFFSTLPYQGVLKPRVDSIIAHLQSLGVAKICLVGFCWGGWLVSQVLADPAYGTATCTDVVCGASPHPSIGVEGWAHQGSNEALVAKITKPFMLLPAGNDTDDYRPGGCIWDTLQASSPGSRLVDEFKDMIHGWSVRGDIADPTVDRDVKKAINHIVGFFNTHAK